MSSRPTHTQHSAGAAGLERLYRGHGDMLRRYVAKTFGAGPPDPEDVVHIAFEKFAALDDPTQVENPQAFLKTTARNYVLDQRRRMKVRRDYAVSEQIIDSARDDFDAERVLSAKERWEIIERAIRSMDAHRQEVLIMHRIHELSYAEIARRKAISPTLAKMLVAQALVICERALREGGGA